MEERCVSEEVKDIRIPSFDEVRVYILNVCVGRIVVPRNVKRRYVLAYLSKTDKINSYLISRLSDNLGRLSKVNVSGFYQEMLKLAGIDGYERTLNLLRRRMRVVNKLWSIYRIKIKSSLDSKEARKVFREYVGRVLSTLRRSSSELDFVRDAVAVLSKIPCVERLPTIVVAGMPQTGKSTFISKVSTAKPKISPFPFTTKDIILGHIELNGLKIQIIDTPGILDRPLSELNPIERRAYIAIKYLADHILYLIDPLEDSYYSIDSQLKLLQTIIDEFSKEKVTIVINKVDSVKPERLGYIKSMISEKYNTHIYTISALKNINTHDLVKDIVSKIISKRLTHTV